MAGPVSGSRAMHADDRATIKPSAQASVLARRFGPRCARPVRPNSLFFLTGAPLPAPIPPSVYIPVPAPWSDLIVARIYVCVFGKGGEMDSQRLKRNEKTLRAAVPKADVSYQIFAPDVIGFAARVQA